MYKFDDPITDAEHDFIIRKFSDLCEIVCLDDYDQHAREELLVLFLHYTSEHFQREEEVMKRAEYPYLEAHVLSHAYMQREFEHLREAMPTRCPNLRTDLGLLRQMFLQHILTFDETYGEWLAKQRKDMSEDPSSRSRNPDHSSHETRSGLRTQVIERAIRLMVQGTARDFLPSEARRSSVRVHRREPHHSYHRNG